jgi:benzoyl-CoA reductase/2-hydroxyglutaryl-CoA dehydratase subunit BcrC/BadD/HgdB
MTLMNDIAARLADPYGVARAAAAQGRRVVGYVGDDVPVELVLAADALPVRLAGTVDAATPLADRYLESSFAPAHRSLVEQWLSGALGFIDAVVFARSNDGAQRLYYYLCELQRRAIASKPTPLIFDLARIDRETSRAHTQSAAATLATQLGTSRDELDAAQRRVRERLLLAERLQRSRHSRSPLSGCDAVRVWQALQLDWTGALDAQVRDWCDPLGLSYAIPRLMITGSTPPDDRLHRAVEDAAGVVVDEWFDEALAQTITRWTSATSDTSAIADAYRAARTTAATWTDRAAIATRARAVDACAVIVWLIEQDEAAVWELPQQIAHLREAKIPVLTLTRQRWDTQPDALAPIAAFVQTLDGAA